MKGTAILFFCMALAAAKPRKHDALRCFLDSETTEFQPHEYCHQFNQCVDGTSIAQTCPADLLFNIELEICDWPLNVNCSGRINPENRPEGIDEQVKTGGYGHSDPSLAPEICAAEDSEGVLVAHENCNQFYVCNYHHPAALKCPGNLLYNPENERCDWPENVECGERIILKLEDDDDNFSKNAEIACAQEDSEGALVAHKDCNRFYSCNAGTPVAFNCPTELMYNIKAEYCDLPSNVECDDRLVTVIKE